MKARDLFATIRTEGGLLPADLLERISRGDGDLKGLDPRSYHLAEDERLNEMISRSWNRMVGAWAGFRAASEKLPETDLGTSSTRERWLLVLFQELGYGRLRAASATEIEGKSYPVSHMWDPSPIHLVGCRVDLDRRTPGVAGAARSSPHSLVQEFLNRSDDHLWGFVSNGLRLRNLRDNSSLTRQAYVEFDLEGMMEGEVFADFVLLWLLCHQSRIEAEDTRPETCWLERWAQAAQEQGVRALETLRAGVEAAIKALGSGFLDHPGNNDLREKLRSGSFSTQDYYRQLLRLVYRLLFLFVAEDRDLLLHPESEAGARERYNQFYSTVRLRRMAERLRGTKHADVYRGLRVVMEKLGSDEGCPALGLPALGSFLWSKEAIADLESCDISNLDLLEAVRKLATTEEQKVLRSVDFKNLGSEELGSVYESLLELHPEINTDSATFELRTASGHERKTTGSYYTPSSLIQCLMDSALEPVLDEAVKKPDPRQAILDLKVCDPACGSGHFLIAAAHRMARRLAAIETGDEEPAPDAMRHALRQIIGHCIYGVDLNPMAVELCKVGLWLESLEPGKPLSFLEHRIQCGNSLLGSTPALLAKGIPDDAFKAIEGDDKEIVKAYRKQNRDERRGQRTMFAELKVAESLAPYETLSDGLVGLDRIDDSSIEGIHKKEDLFEKLSQSESHRRARLLADALCATFVWKKTKDFPYPITQGVFDQLKEHPEHTPTWMLKEIDRLSDQYKFFHWYLAFPDVFPIPGDGGKPDNEQCGWSGGFDFVGGNPPWERVKLQEKEWFAERRPDIANAPNAAARRKMVANLRHDDPAMLAEFLDDRRRAEGESSLVRKTGRYPLCGRGDVNTYAVFAELKRGIAGPSGRVGCVVPSGIATDDTTKFFFREIMQSGSLVSLYSFFEVRRVFLGTDSRSPFCLLTMSGAAAQGGSDFVFFARSVEDVNDAERHFALDADDLRLINPNTLTCPVFRSKRDAEITKSIYRRIPALVREAQGDRPEENPWDLRFSRMFDMANDSQLFHTRDELEAQDWRIAANRFLKGPERCLPLYEAKMVHLLDSRFGDYRDYPEGAVTTALPAVPVERLGDADYCVLSRYWVGEKEVDDRLSDWPRRWLVGFRSIARSTDERTMIAAVLPRTAVSGKLPLVIPKGVNPEQVACLVANVTSHVFDYCVRQKLGGSDLAYHYVKQFPVVHPDLYKGTTMWSASATLQEWITPRVLELAYTSWELADFANDCGYLGPPFEWEAQRRFLLRCEVDACFFHVYGISREDSDYILDTFTITKRKDERQYGEYFTKRTVLEIYDEMAEAMRTRRPYQTRLDPPPGPPADGLPDWPPGAPRPANWPSHIHPPRHATEKRDS